MTADAFRKLALALPDAVEQEHMKHPDFRVGGKIFATLGYPSEGWAMVKLTPDGQEMFMSVAPEIFSPVKGTWGLRGATLVNLKSAKTAVVRDALSAAWKNVAKKGR